MKIKILKCLFGKKEICKKNQKEKFILKSNLIRNNHFTATMNIPILGKILEINFFEKNKQAKKEKFIIHSFTYIKSLSLSRGEIVEFPQVAFIGFGFHEAVNLEFSDDTFKFFRYRKQLYLHQDKKSKFFPDENLTYNEEVSNESYCNLIFLNSKFFSSICRNHTAGTSAFTSYTKYVFYKNEKTGFKKHNLRELFTESGKNKIFNKVKIEFSLDSEKLIIYFSEGILLSNSQGDFPFEFVLLNFNKDDKTEIIKDIFWD